MEPDVRTASPQERLYARSQSAQIAAQTGCTGCLRGHFGTGGKEFHTAWEDVFENRKTEAFESDLQSLLTGLREEGTHMLKDRSSLREFCLQNPEGSLGVNSTEYIFRAEAGSSSFLLRADPFLKGYDFFIYCYGKDLLDQHMRRAQNGIRFVSLSYEELFRIPDGDGIRIICPDGTWLDRTCRFVDETHVEIGGGWESVYHIQEFAEKMSRCGNTVIPLRSSLPEQCYGQLPATGEIVILRRGESGFYRTTAKPGSRKKNAALVEKYNAKYGVGKAQAEAMMAGSTLGWSAPEADPAHYAAKA